jgi:cyanophycinase
MTGPLALVGGSEWRDGCSFDAELLAASGGATVTVLATAAAFEGPAKLVERAARWFATLGATVREVPVYTRTNALDPAQASLIRGASFLYLADGSSQHLRSVLLGTPVWDAIVDAWRAGAVLAASAQSATALCDHMVDNRGGAFTVGLGLLSGMTVIPHYDQWSPDKRQRTVKLARPDLVVAGVDERSALIRDRDGTWTVSGAAGAVFFRGGAMVAIDSLRPN